MSPEVSPISTTQSVTLNRTPRVGQRYAIKLTIATIEIRAVDIAAIATSVGDPTSFRLEVTERAQPTRTYAAVVAATEHGFETTVTPADELARPLAIVMSGPPVAAHKPGDVVETDRWRWRFEGYERRGNVDYAKVTIFGRENSSVAEQEISIVDGFSGALQLAIPNPIGSDVAATRYRVEILPQ